VVVLFIASLIITFIFVRTTSHFFHDKINYNTPHDMTRTFTGWLRKKTGFDIHHIHLGFILVIFVLAYLLFNGIDNIVEIALGISVSLIADQIFPLFGMGNYFSKKMIFVAIILHIIIILIAIKIF
jgi:hypothetical protein